MTTGSGWHLPAAQALFVAALMACASATAAGAPADPAMERGRYLARAGDCISCHTGPAKIPFAGGLAMDTPFGKIVSTNITPDVQAGIGNYTEADFSRAVREGLAPGGRHLYPAMPYTSFTRVSDADVHALFVYFRQGVAPAAFKPPATELPFPFSIRALVGVWNWIYLDKGVYQPDSAQSVQWNRGAYLVQGLGHCGDCHTPRSVIGGVKASSEQHGSSFLGGAVIDGWLAQPLRHGDRSTAAQWPVETTVAYLQTGRTAHSASFGPMSQVVENSTQYLTADDLASIAVYLRSVGAQQADAPPATQADIVAAAPNHPTTKVLSTGAVQGAGAIVYLNNCNACHRSNGTGASHVFPALAGNSVVNAHDPTSLIRMVLQGSAMPSTEQAPSALAMPGFSWRLSDDNVADLLTFLRSSWGNQAEAVSAEQIGKVRKSLKDKR